MRRSALAQRRRTRRAPCVPTTRVGEGARVRARGPTQTHAPQHPMVLAVARLAALDTQQREGCRGGGRGPRAMLCVCARARKLGIWPGARTQREAPRPPQAAPRPPRGARAPSVMLLYDAVRLEANESMAARRGAGCHACGQQVGAAGDVCDAAMRGDPRGRAATSAPEWTRQWPVAPAQGCCSLLCLVCDITGCSHGIDVRTPRHNSSGPRHRL